MIDVTTSLQAPIFSLVGVLVGAVITALGNLIPAVRRERRDDIAFRNMVKQSARLVGDDLAKAQSANRSSLTLNQWTFTPKMYEMDAWLHHRDTLAAALTESDWDSLTFGIWSVGIVRDVRRANFDQPNPQWSLTANTRAAIEHSLDPIENALKALKSYASDISGPALKTPRIAGFKLAHR